MPPFRDIASEINKDPLSNVGVEDLLQEAGYEVPTKKPNPLDIKDTPDELMAKAATPEDKTWLEKIFKNAAPNFASGVAPAGTTASLGVGFDTFGGTVVSQVVKGVIQGVTGVAQTAAQLAYDVADSFDNAANYYGITQDEMLQPYKIDWKSKLQSPDDNPGTKLIAGLTEYLAPGAAAAKMLKLGSLGMAAMNVAIDTFAMDPNQERLSNLITNTAPELRDYAVLGNALKYLEHTDGEGNWEGRIKNGIESLLVNSLFLGAPKAMEIGGKAFTGAKTGASKLAESFMSQIKANTTIKTVETAVSGSTKTAESIAAGGAKVAETAPIIEAAATTQEALFKSPLLNKQSKVYGKLFGLNLENVDTLIPRTTNEEVISKGTALLQDEESIFKLISKDPSKEAYTPEEIYAITQAQASASAEITTVAKNVDKLSAGQVADFIDALTAQKSASVIEEGAGRVSGQSLQARKIEPADLTVSEFNAAKLQDEQLRLFDEAMTKLNPEQQNLVAQDKLRLMGGEEAARKFIKDLGELSLNDIEKAKWLEKISKEGTLPKMSRALQYVMYNNMLGVGTSVKAALGNTVNTFINTANAVASVGLRSFRNSDTFRTLQGLPVLTESEKAFESLRNTSAFRGIYDGYRKAIGSMGRSIGLDRLGIKLPEGENAYSTTKLDMGPKGLSGLSDVEKFGITNDSSYTMKVFGEAMHNFGLRGVTTKIVGKQDEFFGGLNYYSKLSELVTEDLISKGTSLDNFENAYRAAMNDPKMALHQKAMDHAELSVLAKNIPEDSIFRDVQDNPVLKTIFPFARVTYNTVEFTLQNSPFRALSLFSENSQLSKIMKTGTQLEKDEAVSKIIVGTTALFGLGYLASVGDVTGAESPNWRIKQALADSGKDFKPYSIGGVSLEFVENVKPYMDLANIMANANKYFEADQYHDFSVYLTSSILNFMTADRFLENVSNFTDLYDAVSNGELNSGKQLASWGANFTGRFFPKLGNEAAQIVEKYQNGDAYKRQLKENGEAIKNMGYFLEQVKNQFKNDIPYYNQDLAVQRNILGEPQLMPSLNPLATNNGDKSEIMSKLEILAKETRENPGVLLGDTPPLNLTLPGKVVRIPSKTSIFGVSDIYLGGNYAMPFELNNSQWDKYMQYYGNIQGGAKGPSLRKTLEKALDSNGVIWKNLSKPQPEDAYRKALKSVTEIFTEARQRANYLIMQDPEFRAEYNKKLKTFTSTQKQFILSDGGTSAPTMLGQ